MDAALLATSRVAHHLGLHTDDQSRTSCLQGALVQFIGKLRSATATQTDERVRLMGETIGGMLAAKLLGGWVGWGGVGGALACPRREPGHIA